MAEPKKKVLAIDIDGTILVNTTQKTIDKKTGKRYSPEEWQLLEDRYEDMSRWDFTTEWEDRDLNIQSILYSEGIQANLDIIEEYRRKGYEITYITSRGGGKTNIQEDINAALSQRMGYNISGYALGDYNTYGTDKLPVKKQKVLQQLKDMYDEVVFMDDEDKNLELAIHAGVLVIKALRN